MAENTDYQWDFSDFYKGDKEFLTSLNTFSQNIDNLKENFVNLSLIKKLTEYYKIALEAEKLNAYAELNSDLDLANETYLNYKNQVYNKKGQLDYFKNIINEEIIKIDEPLNVYMEKHPDFKPFYMHFYNVLRLKKYNIASSLVTKESFLINQINNLYNTLTKVEMPYEEMEIEGNLTKINTSIFNKYLKSSDRNIRKEVFTKYMQSYKNINKSISGLFNLRYQICSDIASEKGYTSIIEQVIKEDDLDLKIINNLIKCVHSNLNILARYLELKKKKLGVDELHYYDLSLNEEYDKKYSFDEAIALVKEALKIMGDDYNRVLTKALSSGCIDAFSKEHKFSGGYHFRNYIKPMILMNYKDSFKEVITLAHELGHAVNGLFIKENVAYQNFHFSVFLSEVASTVNEDRMERYFYENACTEKEKIVYLEQIIDKSIMAIFFQTLFLEFQKTLCTKIESGEGVNADFINQTFLDLYSQYYTGLTIDEELQYLWEMRLHLFYGNYRYYNFQYATGKIAALVINKNIDENNKEDYLNFLKIGGSMPTLDALKIAGVDLTDPQVINDAFVYLNNLLDEYEKLINNSIRLKKVNKKD